MVGWVGVLVRKTVSNVLTRQQHDDWYCVFIIRLCKINIAEKLKCTVRIERFTSRYFYKYLQPHYTLFLKQNFDTKIQIFLY